MIIITLSVDPDCLQHLVSAYLRSHEGYVEDDLLFGLGLARCQQRRLQVAQTRVVLRQNVLHEMHLAPPDRVH